MRRCFELLFAFGLLHLGYLAHGSLGPLLSLFPVEAALVVLVGPLLVSGLWWPKRLPKAVNLGLSEGPVEAGEVLRAVQTLRLVRRVVLGCGGLGLVVGAGMLLRADYASRDVQSALSLAWSSSLYALLFSEFVLVPLLFRSSLQPGPRQRGGVERAAFLRVCKFGMKGLALGSLVWLLIALLFGGFRVGLFLQEPIRLLWLPLSVFGALAFCLAWMGSSWLVSALETTWAKDPTTTSLQRSVLVFSAFRGLFYSVAAWQFGLQALLMFHNLSDEGSLFLLPSLIHVALGPVLLVILSEVWFGSRLSLLKRMITSRGLEMALPYAPMVGVKRVPAGVMLSVVCLALAAETVLPNIY